MKTVFYSKREDENFFKKLKNNLKNSFKGCKKIAIKIHFGEPGNKYAFKPEEIKPITNILRELNIDFFL